MTWIVNASPGLGARSNYPVVIGLCTTFGILMLIAVGLRLWVRRSRLMVEDGIVVLGAVLSVVYNVLVILQTRYGLGLPKPLRPPEDLSTFLVLNYSARPFQWIALTCFKVALCMSYLRMINRTSLKLYRVAIYFAAALVVVISIIGTAMNIFNCNPIRKSLNPRIPGHCIDYASYNYATWGINVVLDFYVFLLPVPLFMRMEIDNKLKLELCSLFSLSVGTTVLGIWKLQQVNRIAFGDHDSTMFCILNALEANVGIILSSIPHLRPLYRSHSANNTPQRSGDHRYKKSWSQNTVKIKSIGGTHATTNSSKDRPRPGRSASEDYILEPVDFGMKEDSQHFSGHDLGIIETREYTVSPTP